MKKYSKRIWNIFILIFLIGILGFSYSYYEARNLKVRKYDFVHQDIPNSFVDKKIVFIADTHCNQYFTPTDVKELVALTNSMNPDIVVFGGDYTNADTTYSTPFFKELANLKATYGVYSVMGNHDYWEDIDIIKQGMAECGFYICDNASYWIHQGSDSIKIGGVGDVWEDEQIIENTIYDVVPQDFCILLSHNPDFIEDIEPNLNKVDLMLSGHTHGGQVTVFGLYAPIMPTAWKPHLKDTGQKYRYGWKELNDIQLYITTGVGMGKFPFRFFAPPEIVEITLKKE